MQASTEGTRGGAANLIGALRAEAARPATNFLQRVAFGVRLRHVYRWVGLVREGWFYLWGTRVGKGTVLPRLFITWPH